MACGVGGGMGVLPPIDSPDRLILLMVPSTGVSSLLTLVPPQDARPSAQQRNLNGKIMLLATQRH